MTYTTVKRDEDGSWFYLVALGPMVVAEGHVDSEEEADDAITEALASDNSQVSTISTVDGSGAPTPAAAQASTLFVAQSRGSATRNRYEFAFGDGTGETSDSAVNELGFPVPSGMTLEFTKVATRSRSGGSATYKLAVSDTTGASPTVSDFSITHSGYAGQGDGSLIVAGPATVHIKTTSVGSSRPSDVNLSAFGYVTLA